MIQKEPYYVVDFNMSICNFEILINDIPAFRSMDGGSLSSHYPINHFVLGSGVQEITIKVLPLLGEFFLRKNSYLKIKVHSYDSSSQDYSDLNEVFKYETPSFENKNYPAIIEKNVFKAVVPYNIEGWSSSIDIKEHHTQGVLNFYKKVHELASTNTDELFQLFNIKFEELDKALYLNDNNEKEWGNLLAKLNGENFILQPFPSEVVTNIYAGGKIAELLGVNGTQILNYKNNKDEEFNLPFFIHRRSESINFEIIR